MTNARFKVVSEGLISNGVMIERLFEEAQTEGAEDQWEPVAEVAVSKRKITVHVLDTALSMGTLDTLDAEEAEAWSLLFSAIAEAIAAIRGSFGEPGNGAVVERTVLSDTSLGYAIRLDREPPIPGENVVAEWEVSNPDGSRSFAQLVEKEAGR